MPVGDMALVPLPLASTLLCFACRDTIYWMPEEDTIARRGRSTEQALSTFGPLNNKTKGVANRVMAMTCMGTSGEFWEPNSDLTWDLWRHHLWVVDCGWTDGQMDGICWMESTDVSSRDIMVDMALFSWHCPYWNSSFNGNRNGRWLTLNSLN